MTRDEFLQKHWQYYCMLEEDFCSTNRYVELCEDNFETYSKEFYKQLMAICMEIEAVMIAMSDVELSQYAKINEFGPPIERVVPGIQQIEVVVKNRCLKIKPFENWDTTKPKKSLFWWQLYDEAKHNRLKKESGANLKTVLYALAGLHILERMYLKQIVKDNTLDPDTPLPESTLFSVYDIIDKWIPASRGWIAQK